MIQIAIIGAAGRMGKSNILTAFQDENITISHAIGHNHSINMDAGILSGCGLIGIPINNNLEEALQKTNVLIDFSMPKSTLHSLKKNLLYKKAFVIGTTGFSEEEKKIIENYSQKFPIVLSPNFSIGINVLLKLTKIAAKLLNQNKGYDLEIMETHHRFKKDAPSGTAIKIAEIAAENSGRNFKQDAIYKRQGLIQERKSNEIGIFSMRAGDIVGKHELMFCTLGEKIELSHTAYSRETFSKGAILAAKWIHNKKAEKLYDMDDVLIDSKVF